MFREAVLLVDVQESLTPWRTLDFVCWVFSFCGVLNDSRVCFCCAVWQWVLERSDEQKKRQIFLSFRLELCLCADWSQISGSHPHEEGWWWKPALFSASFSDSSSSEVQLRWKKLLVMINTVKIFLIHTLKIRLWYFICSNYISDAMEKNDG